MPTTPKTGKATSRKKTATARTKAVHRLIKPDTTDTAYLAGYIDARGDLSSWSAPKEHPRAFFLCDEPLSEWLIARWGGTYKTFTSSRKQKEISGWFLSKAETLNILEAILPYAKLRRARVEKVISNIKERS